MNDFDVRESIRERHRLSKDAAVGRLSVHGAKVKVGAERLISGVATTDDIDLDTEVVVQGGCDASYFTRNKSVFLDHIYTMDKAVGRLRSQSLRHDKDGRIVARSIQVHVRTGGLGDDVLAVAKEIGIGFSIGFNATEFGAPTDDEVKMYGKGGVRPQRIIREWEWLETSFTCLPCNVSCQVDGAGSVDDSKAGDLSRMVAKGMIRLDSAEALGLPRRKKTIVYMG